MRHALRTFLGLAPVVLFACGDDVTKVTNVEAPSSRSLIATSAEAAGANCPDGGTKITAGTDDNGDGNLDAEEVDSTQYVCAPDVYAGESFANVYVQTLDDVASAQAFAVVSESFGIQFSAGSAAADLTFDKLRFVRGSVFLSCNGLGLTVHLPNLESVGGDFNVESLGGCAQVVIDAPKLSNVSIGVRVTGHGISALSLPALKAVGDIIRIQETAITHIAFPALQRITSVELADNPSLSECEGYALMTQVINAGNSIPGRDFSGNIACTDANALIPIVNIAETTDQFRAAYIPQPWSEARTSCQSFGAGWDLAYFTSAADLASVAAAPVVRQSIRWIGYSDLGTEGTFAWVQNTVGNSYAPQGPGGGFWLDGQPDAATSTQDCASLNYDSEANTLRAVDSECDATQYLGLCRRLP